MSRVNVRLGEWNTNTTEDCVVNRGFEDCSDPPVDIGVNQIIAHPDYDDNSRERLNDIGLVRLSRSVTYSGKFNMNYQNFFEYYFTSTCLDFIRPICLPQPRERAQINERLFVAGWGQTESASSSAVKLKLQLPIIEPNSCRNTFRRFSVDLDESQVCAGGEKDKDSCKGDSGGPLMNTVKSRSEQWYVEGIVSFGATCGSEGIPGIYTRVESFLDWINRNVKA